MPSAINQIRKKLGLFDRTLSWKNRLKPASYKNIPFYTDSSQFDFGRTIKIDRPGSGSSNPLKREKKDGEEGVVIKDLGTREYEIMVKVYFIGDNYIENRDRFEKAFMDGGAQTLILPLEAPMSVIPNRARRRWSNKEGGIEYIEASFLLATKLPDDRIEVDTSKDVAEKAEAVNNSVEGDFAKKFTVEETAPFVEESSVSLAEQFADVLDSAKGFGAVTDVFEEWSESLDNFTLDIAEVIRIPERMVADMVGLTKGVEQAFRNIDSAIDSMIDLFENFEFSSLIPEFDSDDRQQQYQNNNSMTAVFKGVSLSQLCQMSAQQSFSSKEEALQRLDLLTGYIDETLSAAGEREPLEFLHEPLSNMRASIVKDMLVRAADLPAVVSLKPPTSRPILTIAYDIYGDVDKEQDLIDRNKIRNPNQSTTIMEVISP